MAEKKIAAAVFSGVATGLMGRAGTKWSYLVQNEMARGVAFLTSMGCWDTDLLKAIQQDMRGYVLAIRDGNQFSSAEELARLMLKGRAEVEEKYMKRLASR